MEANDLLEAASATSDAAPSGLPHLFVRNKVVSSDFDRCYINPCQKSKRTVRHEGPGLLYQYDAEVNPV